MSQENYVLEMRGITKQFPGTRALDGVDFNLLPGEVHALIGENGAGKSTLMNVLMGIYQPNAGQIFINGKQTQIHSPLEALQAGIGLVPQELNLVTELSVAENIFLGREQRNHLGLVDWNKTNEAAQALLADLHVKDISPQTPAGELSAAFQQLVSIARILASGTKVIILDEPTASLTIKETENLFSIMRELKEKGCSFIFITHHLDEVLEISDRVTILRDGRFVHRCATDEITVDQMIYYMANRKVEQAKHVERTVSPQVKLKVQNFSRKREFQDISFEVHEQEIFGIAGLVGAGRTELVNAIYGLSKRDSGELLYDGKPVNIQSPTDAMRLGIGYITEERRKLGIFAEMPVDVNMMLPSLGNFYQGGLIHYKSLDSAAQAYVDQLSIKTPSLETRIKYLSGGNQQKVLIARWLEKRSDFLILDEPTRGIDVRSKGEIYQLIRKMADEGKTILMISSETDELLAVCDRIMVMHEGRIKGMVDKPGQCTREDILKITLQ